MSTTFATYKASPLNSSAFKKQRGFRKSLFSLTGGFLILTIWLGSYLILSLLNIWLWETHSQISTELLYWQSRSHLVFSVSPPDLRSLVLTDAPLPMYVMLLSGSAFNGVALLGATGITMLALLFWRTRTPAPWLPLLVFHPALFMLASQYPTAFLRVILLATGLGFLLAYLRRGDTVHLLITALMLGTLVMVDLQLAPLYLILAATLLLARPGKVKEQITLLLIFLFPVAFMTISWLYLNWLQSDDPLYFWNSPYGALTNIEAWAIMSPWQQTSVINHTLMTTLETLSRFAPTYFLFALIAIWKLRPWQRQGVAVDLHRPESISAWVGLGLIFLLPIIDLFLAGRRGQAALPALTVSFALITLPFLWQIIRTAQIKFSLYQEITYIVLGTGLLLLGTVSGWVSIWQTASEPQQLLHATFNIPTAAPVAPFREIAGIINQELEPGDKVLFDHAELFPFLELLEDKDAIVLPYHVEYQLARQSPSRFVDYVIVPDPASILGSRLTWSAEPANRLENFDMITRRGDLFLFKRREN